MSEPLRCTVRGLDGFEAWFDPKSPHAALAMKDKRCEVEDLREALPAEARPSPWFVQLLPCPYCGVREDRNHDKLRHVNWKLGKKNGT